MSYDLYCYKSELGKPNVDEARRVIEVDEDEQDSKPNSKDRQNMKEIAEALVAFDPRLEIFQFDYEKIAESQSISVDEAHHWIDYVEVNTPKDAEHYVQFNISKDHVSVSFGFGMPDEFLDRVMAYVDVICKKTGYFLYDPQGETVSDPLHPIELTRDERKSWTDDDEINFLGEKKPWWKFW